MKTVLKFTAYVLFIGTVLFMSCSKNSSNREPPPAPQPFSDTLTGREFEFNDLTWRELAGLGNVIVEIDRPDLFFNPFRVLKITIRLDGSAVWLDVPHDQGSPYPAGFNFFYSIGGSDYFFTVNGRLYILPYPANLSLKGTKVFIRVKFI
jgi:hypothetical protein